MARKFFIVAAGMFLLALSYHFGASTATAQAPGNPVVGFISNGPAYAAAAITANGDVYTTSISALDHNWVLAANIFAGGAASTLHESWGQVKARYRSTPGMTVTPGADNR